MPVVTNWEPEGLVFIASGVITAEEILAINFDFLDVPEGVIPRYQIIDATKAERFELDKLDLVNISADDLSVSRKYPDIKVAMVAGKQNVKEVFMEYMKISWAINTSWEIRIFDSMATAREWLNLSTS